MKKKIEDTKPERWITSKELCTHLGIGRHTMITWIEKHGMPAHQIGKRWRFKFSEIEKWMEEMEEKK